MLALEGSKEGLESRPESAGSGEVKKLADLRSSLQERIRELESELDELKTLLGVLDRHLTQVSFRKASVHEASEAGKIEEIEAFEEPSEEEFSYERTLPLKTTTGILLAEMQIGSESLHVVLTKEVNLNPRIPPFESFLVNRIFKGMIDRDEEDISNNTLSPEMKFGYETMEAEDGTIEEIVIKNFRTDRRLRELRTSLRWTLEKMYDKISGD